MQSRVEQAEGGAPGVTRRAFRLLVLLGLGIATYVVLSLFEHAARADTGSIDVTNPVASVKTTTAAVRTALPKPKSAAPTSHLATTKTPKVNPPKVQARKKLQAPKVSAPKVQASKVRTSTTLHAPKIRVAAKIPTSKVGALTKVSVPSIRAGETVRRVRVGTSKISQPASDVVRDAVRVTVNPARAAVVRETSLTLGRLPSLHELAVISPAQLLDLPQAALPALGSLPQLSSWPQLPSLPTTSIVARPQLPSLPGGPPARTPLPARTTAALSAPVFGQPLAVSPQVQPISADLEAPGLSGATKAARAQSRTAPLPAPARQPGDQSTTTGQAPGSGSGTAPAMGTVSSTWRPEVTAAGLRLPDDVIARGRTVRYAGPPS